MFIKYFQVQRSSAKSKITAFKFIDSDFYFICKVNRLRHSFYSHITFIPQFIKEYENRKLDVVRNLFLLNRSILAERDWLDMKTLLKDQNYHIDAMYNNVNFNLKYYNDLVKYSNKMMVLE